VNPRVLAYHGVDPPGEGLREALCTLGNGYFATRGAAPEAAADAVHYPGTYVAGCYNRLTSQVADREVENEDLVNVPNWLPLTLRPEGGAWLDLARQEVLGHRQELDLRRGVLTRLLRVRYPDGWVVRVTQRRFVSMADPHLAGLETTLVPENWSGSLEVRSALDGRVANAGVERYRALDGRHLVPVEVGGADGTVWLVVETRTSGVRIAQAARARMLWDGRPAATTTEGIHLGAMAGTVDLVQRCYTGLETRQDVLWLNPSLPQELDGLDFEVRYRGHWGTQPLGAQRDQHREGAGEERPEEWDVAGHEGHDGNRPGQGDSEQDRAQPDHGAVHQPDDGEPPGVAPERVDGVRHDLAAHAVRKPWHHGDLPGGPVDDQPPVLHEKQQDQQAGDDPHDQHGDRAQPGHHHPGDDRDHPDGEQDHQGSAQPPGHTHAFQPVDQRHEDRRQDGREHQRDDQVTDQPQHEEHDRERDRDPHQPRTRPSVWNQAGGRRPGSRSTAGISRPPHSVGLTPRLGSPPSPPVGQRNGHRPGDAALPGSRGGSVMLQD
jgi:Glycosyl hydrolase family 65, N-terminal domain/Glycosyl hydrolase family 65, C-terminal domain